MDTKKKESIYSYRAVALKHSSTEWHRDRLFCLVLIVCFALFHPAAQAFTTLSVPQSCPPKIEYCADRIWQNALSDYIRENGFVLHVLKHDKIDGAVETERIKKLVNGDYSLVVGPVSMAGEINSFLYGFNAPFMFDSFGHLYRVMQNVDLHEKVNGDLAPHGVRLLSIIPSGGFAGIFNTRREVVTVEHFRTLRMRAQDRLMLETFRAWKVPSIIMSWNDAHEALRNGLVDGYIASPVQYLGFDKNEGITHFTDARMMASVQIVLANESWYQSLSDRDRRLLLEGIKSADRTVRDWAMQGTDRLLSTLRENGVQIKQLSQTARKKLAKASQSVYRLMLHPDDFDIFQSTVENNR